MNYFYVTRKLVVMGVVFTMLIGSSVECMKSSSIDLDALISNNQDELPPELKKYILYLALEQSLSYNFTCSKELEGHSEGIESVEFSPQGTTVFTGSADSTACLWDVKTGQQLHILKGH
ncbi:hypothetical protein H0W26_01345, partial [Candidatus Dependentiae bacterium]|nr:hypothetical protein [Candidatus Dependentiae bacterium]